MAVTGITELKARLEKMIADADLAGQRVVKRSEVLFQAAVIKSFTQSHARGTVTPSAAGGPPAVVTGALRRSFVSTAPVTAAGGWSGKTYPTTVYARIQELGGTTGRGGATPLPARPYMKPTLAKVLPQLAAIHREEFGKVVA